MDEVTNVGEATEQNSEEEEKVLTSQDLTVKIRKLRAEGTLSDFSSKYVILQSVFETVPLVLFLYAIFQLIYFIVIRDYTQQEVPKVGGKEGETMKIWMRNEVDSIKFRN